MRFFRTVGIIVSLLLAGWVPALGAAPVRAQGDGPSSAPDPVIEARIVFSSDRDGDSDIYVMDSDGSNAIQLTSDDVRNWGPQWSPDGREIAFVTEPSEQGGIYDSIALVKTDGEVVRTLSTRAHVLCLDWSPDGESLVYLGTLPSGEGDSELYFLNVDDPSEGNRLTDNNVDESCPDWSPDGSLILFASEEDGQSELYTVTVDGDELTRLTESEANETLPAWSPDGRQIAFVSNRSGGNELSVMDADGRNVRQITEGLGTASCPDWSPDGLHLSLTTEEGDTEIYTMDTDGSDLRRLTTNSAQDNCPAWSPAGVGEAQDRSFFSALPDLPEIGEPELLNTHLERVLAVDSFSLPNCEGTGDFTIRRKFEKQIVRTITFETATIDLNTDHLGDNIEYELSLGSADQQGEGGSSLIDLLQQLDVPELAVGFSGSLTIRLKNQIEETTGLIEGDVLSESLEVEMTASKESWVTYEMEWVLEFVRGVVPITQGERTYYIEFTIPNSLQVRPRPPHQTDCGS